MAKMPNTVQISGARGTKILKATGPDKSGMMKGGEASMLKPSMGGSRSNLDHTLKC
jgi:hypothetical protein